MKNILIVLMSHLLFLFSLQGQSNVNCNLLRTIPITQQSIDTFSLIVIYKATNMDFRKNSKDDFYTNLKHKYDSFDLLCFSLENCQNLFFFPIANDNKYEYKLFRRKNPKGKYENWIYGQSKLKIKCIRYNNHYYLSDASKRFGHITIITNIEEIKM